MLVGKVCINGCMIELLKRKTSLLGRVLSQSIFQNFKFNRSLVDRAYLRTVPKYPTDEPRTINRSYENKEIFHFWCICESTMSEYLAISHGLPIVWIVWRFYILWIFCYLAGLDLEKSRILLGILYQNAKMFGLLKALLPLVAILPNFMSIKDGSASVRDSTIF